MKKLLLCALLLLAAPAWAQVVGGSGVPYPVVNGACIIGVAGQPVWGSCSGSGTTVTSVSGTAGQVTVSPTTGDTIVTLPGTITGNKTLSGAITFSGTIAGTGLTTYLASPAAIGGSTPAAGAFTTLSASSTVSGSGFSTYLASPPAIGGSAAAAGAFTNLGATGTVTLSGLVSGTPIASPGYLALDASNHVVLATNGGSSTITLSDGTHSGSVSSITFGNGYLVSIAGSAGTVNGVATDLTKTASYTAVPGDMGQALTLAATSGTPALTLNQSGSCGATTCFAAGMTLTISVPKITSGVNWTVTNSTGLTMRGLNSTTLYPGTQGTFVANNDGATIDFFPGMQAPTTTSIGGILSATAASHNFLTGFDTTGTQTTAQPAFTDISGSVAAAQMPALTGDITTSAGAVATTLATVNANVGSFTAANITVNAKGLVTAAANGSASAGGGTFNYSDNGVTVTAGTYFTPIGGGGIPQATEANVQVKAPSALTVNNLQVGLSADPGSGQTLAVTMRKAGSDQTLTCTVTGTGGGTAISCQDLTHSISVAQNDLIDWKVVTTGTYVATPTITITANSGTTNNGVTGSAVNGNVVKGTGSASVGDSGVVAANLVVASSPGAGIAHFAGSTQTVTSSAIVAADITSATITGTQIASSIALAGSPTTTTQSAKDNSTKIATTAYVDTATGLTAGTSVTLVGPRQYFVCTSTCTVTPPTPAAGYEFCVMNDDNVSTVITMAAIASVSYEATARTSYGTANHTFTSGGAAADKVCILGRDSTHYLTVSFNGTWTLN